MINGKATFSQGVNTIGPGGPGSLSETSMLRSGKLASLINGYVRLSGGAVSGTYTLLVLGGVSQQFQGTPDQFTVPIDGATGSFSVSGGEIVYTAVDGMVARFKFVQLGQGPVTGEINSIAYPTGEVLTFTRSGTGTTATMRVESSLGYALVGHVTDESFDAVAANLTQGGCSVSSCVGPTFANQATLGRALLTSTTGSGGTTVFTVTNPAGGSPRIYTEPPSTGGVDTLTYTDGVGTWTYTSTRVLNQLDEPSDRLFSRKVTDPLGNTRTVKSRPSNQHIVSETNGDGKTTTYQYTADDSGLGRGTLYQVTYPEGNRDYYQFDTRRNVTALWRIPKGASTTLPVDQIPGTTVERASYSCRPTFAGGQNCSSPDWTRDAHDNQTDYAYDSVTGELVSVTQPAGPNNKRPQVRYAYGAFTARYVANGAWVTGAPVRRVVGTSTCASGEAPACVGTADETVTQYAYEDSSQPNNVRLVSKTVRTGNLTGPTALSATTTYAYNARGDVISTDGPLAGSADTTRTYYDASRWKIGEIRPDPDGAESLLYRASRTTYRADGLVTLNEMGTATSQSDTAMDSFTPLAFTRNTYGPTGQLTKTEAGQP